MHHQMEFRVLGPLEIEFVGPDRAVSSSFDGTVLVWDTSLPGRGEGIALAGESAGFGAVAFSPGGNRIASGPSSDFWIRDSATGEPLIQLDSLLVLPPDYDREYLLGLAFIRTEFTRDGSMIATSFSDYGDGDHGTVALWNATDGSVVHSFDSAAAPLLDSLDLDINLNGTLLAATNDGDARVWSLETYEEVLFITPEDGDVVGIALDPSGSRLAVEIRRVKTPRHTVHVEVFDLEGHLLVTTGEHDVFYADGLEFSPDGRYMVTTGLDEAGSGLAVVWDASTGDRAGVTRGTGSEIFQAVVSPDGSQIATGEEGMVRLWDAASFEQIVAFPGHEGFVNDLAFSPDGTRLITLATPDGLVRTWLLDTEELVEVANDHVTRTFTQAECEIHEIDPCPAES